jgi:hypothetical protein
MVGTTVASKPERARHSENPGFFQVSFECLREMANLGLSFEVLAAYLVICAGVDSKREGRVSTHGARSVSERVGIPYRTAQHHLATLEAAGFIVPFGEGDSSPMGPKSSRWIVSDSEPDTQISQTFINHPKGRGVSPLIRIHTELRHSGAVSSRQAKVDVLLLFVWLHRDYDLGSLAGVSPALWHQKFQHVHPEWLGDEADLGAMGELYLDLEDSDLSLVTVALPGKQLIEPSIADEIVPTKGEPESEERRRLRIEKAFENLLALRLAYRAVVVWHGNPVTSNESEPIGTLYINDAWGRDNEPSAQAEHNRCVWRARVLPRESEFDSDGSPRAQGKERYRCLVSSGIQPEIFVVRQIRLRHWAATHAAVVGRELESSRTLAFSQC